MILVLAALVKVLWIESAWGWAVVAVGAVVEVGETYAWWLWSRRRRPKVGAEDLVGREGVVIVACRPEGQIRVFGEIWAARCAEGADAGARVVVDAIDELMLTVSRRVEMIDR